MKFLMFIKHTESDRNLTIPKALNDAMGEFVTEDVDDNRAGQADKSNQPEDRAQ